MSNDVVLTAALRNNLLSLQRTQSSIDGAQLRLATGKKVNSALDNPQNFFASNALKNRASDLQRLLDGIGQNIQVIKAADNGVTALTKLVEQADSIAQSARDALAQGQSEAKVIGDRDLRGIDDLTTVNGLANGDTITLSITDEDGEAVQIGAFGAGATDTATITINTNDSIEELITEINNIQLSDGATVPTANGGQAFEAKLDDKGQLQIRTLNGGDYNAVFTSAAGTTNSDDLAVAQALGFGNAAQVVLRGDPADPTDPAEYSVEFSAVADVGLRSFNLHYTDAGGEQQTALGSTLISDLVLEDGTALFGGIDDAADDYIISVNGGTEVAIELFDGTNALTVQSFVDQINDNDTLNGLIRAEFDGETGQISIVAVDPSVKSIEIGVNGGGGTAGTANFGFGIRDNPSLAPNDLTAADGEGNRESIRVGAAAAELAELEDEYNNIRDQIDQLVSNGDTGYRGTNLLYGDDLTTFFNEFRSSSLETQGVTFTAEGLGLTTANFSREASVDGALANVRSALESVRSFGSTLANDLAIIQSRQDFTSDLINTLTEGSDKLVNADQNEEGAKLLALQTRQQLGVTSLSLASQSQQSILRLF
jgi:flagellin-like hook-associated protein FlgL